ncbi:MAG: hypothetical protein HY741_14930 [Chloroflexi bacterium]|nr:hypothetical protein [Chloroflexota bacterium]
MNHAPNDSDKQIPSSWAAWTRIVLASGTALLWGILFIYAFGTAGVLAIPGKGAIHFGPFAMDSTMAELMLVIELVMLVLIPLVTARLLGYCRVQLGRWGLAGLGSLLAWLGGYWVSSLGIVNLSYRLTYSNVSANYAHALPLATAAACFLAVAWLGASATLWRYSKDFLVGLAVGIALATINGVWNVYVIGGDSRSTFHDFWIVPPFIWTSAVLFIERAAGRADRAAYLVWMGLMMVMFILPIVVIRTFR